MCPTPPSPLAASSSGSVPFSSRPRTPRIVDAASCDTGSSLGAFSHELDGWSAHRRNKGQGANAYGAGLVNQAYLPPLVEAEAKQPTLAALAKKFADSNFHVAVLQGCMAIPFTTRSTSSSGDVGSDLEGAAMSLSRRVHGHVIDHMNKRRRSPAVFRSRRLDAQHRLSIKMPFKLAKIFIPVIYKAFTMTAVLSINGQTSFNFKVVQVALAFELKVTFSPTHNNAQAVPPKRINFHAQGTFSLAHVDRLRTIMRNRRILCPDTPRPA
ncbi:hypothetical protein OH76DRAFT_1422575 [Lentinus brumalis]|uniref:Uncharacterized protein n=1 Tax=Lentinus brumalis TaxID=2498619 RepID=A0A371CPT1_9APHY|nr:hypothetical protein OH76DRAFT_1422575 [Polyporus brumalis]